MSRRTLRGAIPTTDSIVGSTATAGGPLGSGGATVVRPAPGEDPAGGRPVAEAAVDTDAILLRGPAAARARRVDLVGDPDPADLDAVGPWAEHLDDAREVARTSGFQQGRQEGLAAGLEAARHKVEQDRADLGASVETMLDGLQARSEELGAQLAEQVTDLAIEIARAVLDREINSADDPGAEAIARCLDLVPGTGALTARLSPEDAEALGEVPGLGRRELVVAADPNLSRGDAIVSVDQITIDARLSESLRRVEEALR
ncbi:MAG: FliH/SctL family protein [Actinomycetota bacterium]